MRIRQLLVTIQVILQGLEVGIVFFLFGIFCVCEIMV